MTRAPLVDVAVATYNHEKYIARAIESVLAQETSFDYRLIVGDDCSSDGTQGIIREYARRHPGRIVTLFHPERLGTAHRDRVGVKVLRLCTARYVALLDGDDFWTDPGKLQRQVDFLETHPECAACFHDAEVFYEEGAKAPQRLHGDDQKEFSTLEDLLTTGVFPITCTVMFRHDHLRELPERFFEASNPDWMLSVLAAEHGTIGYIAEVMAAYRVHGGGVWSGIDALRRTRQHIKSYETIDAHLGFKYTRLLSKKVEALRATLPWQYRQHARSCLDRYHRLVRRGEVKEGVQALLEAARAAPLEVIRPRRLAAVIKNGLLGVFWKSSAQS